MQKFKILAITVSAVLATGVAYAQKQVALPGAPQAIAGCAVTGTIEDGDIGNPIAGDTTGGTDTVSVACTEWGTVDGAEDIYSFVAGPGANLTFTVTGAADSFDPSIYLLSTCGDGTACIEGSDDVPTAYAPSITASGLTAGETYYFYVDSYWPSSDEDGEGPYTLTVTGTLPVELTDFSID